MKKKLSMLFCLAIVLCAGCGQKTEIKLKDGKEVIASVKGYDLTAEDLFTEMKKNNGANTVLTLIDKFIIDKEVKTTDEIKKEAQSSIDNIKNYYEQAGSNWEEILTQAGYKNEAALLDEYMLSIKQQKAAEKFIRKNVTDEEINEYYDKEIYGEFTVRHILIIPENKSDMTEEEVTAAKEKALSKAKKVIEKLNNGSKWEDLVKKYSDDEASVSSNGEIKFTKGEVVNEFFEASLALEDGKYTLEPVESTYGYHIIYRVSVGEKPSLKDSKNTILDNIVENKINNTPDLLTDTWLKVREKYNFKIADTEINDQYKNLIK